MLTLVDLPGYVQTHTLGQSETIVQEIENLVEKYISEPRTIILAVIPATRDFETNVAIKYIRQFDGQGKRTLRNSPGSKKDVIQRKEKLSEQLKALGPVIETDLEKANLLQKNINEVMQQFKYLVDGHYGAGGFGQDLYLRSLVRDLNEVFNARIIRMTNSTTSHLDVREIMKATRGRELRGMVPLEAFIILCRRVVQDWSSETHQHITEVCQLASNVFAQVIEKRCDKVLINYFSERMIEFVDQQQKAMHHDALEILDDEINLPSTLQDTDLLRNGALTKILKTTKCERFWQVTV
ncbi:hypothetical protein PGTUg99_000177 [Puccinia graminis f. sp. tritici]|uniref:Uncharacterized protein n=1 Tax=Puccinia graminis f. sp. tritici TaxID=56615 RepID=A0A5B0LH88_PUCGR|nr:hypothetical protein PGTUg99_000177 [Puccinia graminis f. sp. tritici]